MQVEAVQVATVQVGDAGGSTSPGPASASWCSPSIVASYTPPSSWPSSPRATSPAGAGLIVDARARARPTEAYFDDLTTDSFVVHCQHGVGPLRRHGHTSVDGGVERDYLLLEYKGGDKLYVPSDQMDLLRPYSGGECPALSRLNGGSNGSHTGQGRVHAVHEIAQELVVLYQRAPTRLATPSRPTRRGSARSRTSFPYSETPDQLNAIEDVKADMEANAPMDRLVCGDVGFGKTEVAIRAAFKAVQDGMQVAVLVPTTLLASQHYQTFGDRYRRVPRPGRDAVPLLDPGAGQMVIAGLGDGSVDIVIGTHRLLPGDITFKDLGLLVVDEEQRFGVSHKEAIKRLRTDVDVLTLTATPIPSTLEMALTGIRDLSLMQHPTPARQPILTYVGEFEEAAVVEAIRRELLREGQVFFVHNWVQNIEAWRLAAPSSVPEAQGRGGPRPDGRRARSRQVVLDFWEGRYDVLVCTTIIESGIDMPT